MALWVDAGFAEPRSVAAFLASGLGLPVIGSESQSDADLVVRLGDRAVLSLDTRGAERLGPAALHDDSALWPSEVIAMTLAQVGAGAGPDLAALAALRARAPHRCLYAAGGVRGPDDLRALRAAGIARGARRLGAARRHPLPGRRSGPRVMLPARARDC